MKKVALFLLAAIIAPLCLQYAQAGDIFDPTDNPCDRDVIMPGCFR